MPKGNKAKKYIAEPAQRSPIPCFTPNEAANKAVVKGKQKKAEYTGMYTEVATGDVYYIKRSANPADDLAEVVNSHMLTFFGVNAAVCKLVISVTGETYVASKCFKDHRPLLSKNEQGLKNGWLGSNPTTEKNKKLLDSKLRKSQEREDLALILWGNAAIRNPDGLQPSNLCRYSDQLKFKGKNTIHVKSRIGNFDFGWGGAYICKNGTNRIVNLFEMMSPVGQLATHKFGGIPTNHYKNWLQLINSPYSIRAAEIICKKAGGKDAILQETTKAVDKVMVGSIDNQVMNLQRLAQHHGIRVPQNLNRNQLRSLIIKNLHEVYSSSINSIAMNAVLLQIKLKINSNGDYLTPEARLKALKNVIEQRFKGRKINSFMPSFDPPVNKLLTALLKEAKGVVLSLKAFCESIIKGINPTKRYTRNVVLAEKSAKPEGQKIQEQLINLQQKYKGSASAPAASLSAPVAPVEMAETVLKRRSISEKAPKVLRPPSLDASKAMLLQYGKQLESASSAPVTKDESLSKPVPQLQTVSADPLRVVKPAPKESSKAILKQFLKLQRDAENARRHELSQRGNSLFEASISRSEVPTCA